MREQEASIGQRLLWLLDHYRGGAGTINVPLGWRIRGPLDARALGSALDVLTARHEALRTTYAARGRRLVQLIHEPRPLEPAIHDLSAEADAATAARAAVEAEVRDSVDAGHWPTTASLYRIAPQQHLFLLNIHHLATDFFSNGILARDLLALYERTIGTGPAELPDVEWQYAEYAAWQRTAFAGGRLERLQSFWGERLRGARPVPLPRGGACEPPASGVAGQVKSNEPMKTTFDFNGKDVERIQALARSLRTTQFPVMLGAFYAHLARTLGESDVAVASLFANRVRPEIRETVGFFVNMLVLRCRIEPGDTFADVVRRTRRIVAEALAHSDLPSQMLPARTIAPAADNGSGSVDDLVFQYLETPPQRAAALDVELLDLPVGSGRFALELVIYNRVHCMLRFAAGFDPAWAAGFLRGYTQLLCELVRQPERALAPAVLPAP